MWTERLPLAFPIALIDEANQLGAIIDPDTGGANTFSPESIAGGYVIAHVPFTDQMRGVVERRNAAEWQNAIAQRAANKGLEPLPVETIELLRAALLVGDECNEFAANA